MGVSNAMRCGRGSGGGRSGARVTARGELLRLVGIACACAAASLLFEATVAMLGASDAAAASMMSLAVTGVLLIGLVAFEVRSWRAVVAACEVAPAASDKVLLAAALWFAGGLPQGVVAGICQLAGMPTAQDPKTLAIQLGVSATLLALAWLRFAPELRRR